MYKYPQQIPNDEQGKEVFRGFVQKCDFQVCLVPPSFTPGWPEFLLSSFKESFEVESFKEMVGLEIFANDTILKQVDSKVFQTKKYPKMF